MVSTLLTWKRRLNDYGVSNTVIIFLTFIAVVASFAEIVSIGIFLPIFEIISQSGEEGLSSSNSKLVIYIHNFLKLFGLDLTIEVLLISSFVLFLFSKILLYVVAYIQVYYTGLITKKMKDRLLDKYLESESLFYDNFNIGNFSNSSSTELPVAVSGVIKPISLIITIISGIGSIFLLMLMSVKLTFLSILVIAIGSILPARWVKETTRAGKKSSQYGSAVTSFLLDRLQSPRLVRLSNTSANEKNNYSLFTEKQRKINLIIHNLKARINLVIEPIVVGISLLMFYLALKVLKMDISVILLFMVVMVRIVPIVRNVLTQKQSINRSIGPIDAINRLMSDMDTSINNRKKHTLSKNLINNVNKVEALKLENVSYRYNQNSTNALTNINCEFKKGSLTAIVGPSGSGKSTFVDIISGYRNPKSGTMFVNDVNINEYSSYSLMSIVSYVSQSPQIFDGISIYEHISYGKEDVTREDVHKAIELSGASDFIEKLPEGLDTVLFGEYSGLSGGQRQRLELSRALLRDTPILILDEPSGNLDVLSEKELMKNIKHIRKTTEKIIIIIAHRLNTIIDADNIIVIEKGEISGSGRHSDMLVKNPWYNKVSSKH
jgi:ABC-type multidrug transport system fused ATPase/permease subunit